MNGNDSRKRHESFYRVQGSGIMENHMHKNMGKYMALRSTVLRSQV